MIIGRMLALAVAGSPLLCAACTSREPSDPVPLAQSGWTITTYVIGRTSALGGGRMEVIAEKAGEPPTVLAKYDDEEDTRVRVENRTINIDGCTSSRGTIVSGSFEGYSVTMVNTCPKRG